MSAADTLKKVPLFADLDNDEIESIAGRMIERHFKAGATLTEQGTSGVGFFVIEDGTADVTVDGEARGSVGPGDYFGEIALLTNSDRTATLTATTDMVTYGLTSWDFKPLVESNSDLAWKLLTAMAAKLT
ncbi:MAG: family transcriptional regulator, cyclic receptor protein [Gaiellaceae bacterium]|jgi:CRP-like cAMP-binding protein|nr:family transcriptional regulator, cyclic receptor protein [Gaiellaceae bacterium]